MLKNYFILNRIIKNITNILSGYSIVSAFSQEKDKLILECRGDDNLWLEISVNARLPYIAVKNKFTRAKKNVMSFFNDIFPSQINGISIAETDRVIKFSLTNAEMYFFIRGNATNLLLIRDDIISSFKKTDETKIQNLINDFRKYSYTSDLLNFIFEEKYSASDKELLAKYPFIGKEILHEAKLRTTDNFAESLKAVIHDIQYNKPALYVLDDEVKLSVEGFRLFDGWNRELSGNILETVNFYIIKKHTLENFGVKKKSLVTEVEKELERTASRINNLRGRIDSGTKEEEYNKTANLLLINIGKFQKGVPEISVEDIYDNNNLLKIKIDPSVSPQKNAERYFEKARGEKISYNKSVELYKVSVEKYKRLKEKLEKLKVAEKIEEIKGMDNIKKSSGGEKDDLKSRFKQYIIDGKYNVYVGRDSENNDLLTSKFAKQNDYWFHARSVSGSHVVLRVENTKESVPKPVLKKAAALAAYHSKAKTSSLAPVAYTLKKYVVKRKGMEPGKVSLLKEEVLLVKPEIPHGCEYISRE